MRAYQMHLVPSGRVRVRAHAPSITGDAHDREGSYVLTPSPHPRPAHLRWTTITDYRVGTITRGPGERWGIKVRKERKEKKKMMRQYLQRQCIFNPYKLLSEWPKPPNRFGMRIGYPWSPLCSVLTACFRQ